MCRTGTSSCEIAMRLVHVGKEKVRTPSGGLTSTVELTILFLETAVVETQQVAHDHQTGRSSGTVLRICIHYVMDGMCVLSGSAKIPACYS